MCSAVPCDFELGWNTFLGPRMAARASGRGEAPPGVVRAVVRKRYATWLSTTECPSASSRLTRRRVSTWVFRGDR